MTRPLDDIDLEIDSITYTIKSLMTVLYKLYDDRDKELKSLIDSVEYSAGCRCSYEKTTRGRVKLRIKKVCSIHGYLLESVDKKLDRQI